MFLDLRAKFQKLKKKTQNSRKKLKLWEDFAPPERPSGVIKKACIKEASTRTGARQKSGLPCKLNCRLDHLRSDAYIYYEYQGRGPGKNCTRK